MTIADPNDLLLVKFILASVLIAMTLAVFLHLRAARGNARIARHWAEIRLARDDIGHWKSAIQTLRSELHARVAPIEERLKHMPTAERLAELEGTMKAMAAETRALSEGQAQMRHTLNRIEDFLLRDKRL